MRARSGISLAASLLLLTSPALAEESTLQQDISKVISQVRDDKFLTFNFENDMIGGGSDRNYTSGVRVTYFDLGTPLPPHAKALDRVVPTFSLNETTSVYYSLGQNLYTPRDVEDPAHQPGDRPWSAFLYGSMGLFTITDNHVDSLEATVGVVGPAALGEQSQKFIHSHISGSPTPKGWKHQLKNEPALMLSWERRWPERISLDRFGWRAGATPHAGLTVGNVYTYANAGASFRVTPFDGRWQDDPIRVRPAMPGTGAFIIPENTFNWYLFSGVEGRAVARNIFLDGNTFTDSHSVDKKHLVLDANAGVAFTYGKARLSYALIYRSPEFDGQDEGDIFGSVSLGLRF